MVIMIKEVVGGLRLITRTRQALPGAIPTLTRSLGIPFPTLINAASGSPSRPTPSASAVLRKSPASMLKSRSSSARLPLSPRKRKIRWS
uniref:Uncharacterized protein MANES_17G000100 n=1 Tax=Rhizophora mucronata TaxID=61149 RepID=A0A2P2KNG8_RHIMU